MQTRLGLDNFGPVSLIIEGKDAVSSVAQQDELGLCPVIVMCSCARKTVPEKSGVRTSNRPTVIIFEAVRGRVKILARTSP